ncbi:MAG: DUF5132 domain-containing protein [Nitrospira sp.]|nr:DUF5132 domain-containing protein [Nitrospira sp.]
MSILEDVLKGSWGTALVGVGIALVAPTVLPAVGAAIRPLLKEAIKGGLLLYDTVKESVAEAGEQVNDMVAEVRAEAEEGDGSPETPRRKSRAKKGAEA